jgi:hypothetical protein
MATVAQNRPLRRGAMNQQGALYDFLFNVKELINTAFPNAGLSLEASAAPSSPSSFVLSGLTGNTAALRTYQATVTVANGATTGKEAAIAMPANFLPFAMIIHCTVAATNACSLVDVGDDADTDSYCDGIVTNDLTSTGFKGIVGCNGVRAMGDITGGVQVATTTADEVEIVVSADPGATGVTVRLTFIGIVAS